MIGIFLVFLLFKDDKIDGSLLGKCEHLFDKINGETNTLQEIDPARHDRNFLFCLKIYKIMVSRNKLENKINSSINQVSINGVIKKRADDSLNTKHFFKINRLIGIKKFGRSKFF